MGQDHRRYGKGESARHPIGPPWPDAATSPFRNEKDSNFEGAFRVPAVVRWPGKIPAGKISREMLSGLDWFPTFLAAAGDTDIKERLLKGSDVGGKTFKVHLDGYNQLPFLTGQQPKSARREFAYFNDDGVLVAFRLDDWKAVFVEMKHPGGFAVWQEPFTSLRVPKLFHLRMFFTGSDSHDVLREWASVPTLAKPTGEAELVANVAALLAANAAE